MTTKLVGLIAVAGLACGAMAGPAPQAGSKTSGLAAQRQALKRSAWVMGPEGPGINENFDSYANGSLIAGQGGWEVWYTGGQNANVSNEQDRDRGRDRGRADNGTARVSGQFRRVDSMSDGEMEDIIAFLNALTDDDFDRTVPAQVPSGLPPGGLIR